VGAFAQGSAFRITCAYFFSSLIVQTPDPDRLPNGIRCNSLEAQKSVMEAIKQGSVRTVSEHPKTLDEVQQTIQTWLGHSPQHETPFHLFSGAGSTFPIRFANSVISGIFSASCGPGPVATPYLNDGNNLQFLGSNCGATIASAYPFLGAHYVPLFFGPARRNPNWMFLLHEA
jgi:hypothetical protein